jgi:hypothetical protein
MKILSIDVGIKNLAFCLLSFEPSISCSPLQIMKWDVINVSEQNSFLCKFIGKEGICNKPAKFIKCADKCFCLKHAKKQELQIPTIEQNPSFINKQSMSKLIAIAEKYSIQIPNKVKKDELLTLIHTYFLNHYFQPIENVNASEVNLFNIGKNIKYHFDNKFVNEDIIDYLIIENQIGPIANRMKTIQGMIVQYFIMSSIQVNHVEFISSSNKLKSITPNSVALNIGKTKYSDRKRMGIQKCLEIITNEIQLHEYIPFFNENKKKDDLSDCFLQGYWFCHYKLLKL